MSDIKAIMNSTLDWASNVAEMWTGTQYEGLIDLRKAEILSLASKQEWSQVSVLCQDLAQFLDYAESSYEF